MIDAAILRRLHNHTTLTNKLGGAKIYVGKAPANEKDESPIVPPYVIIDKIPGGKREKITQKFSEGTGSFHIKVFTEDEIFALNTAAIIVAHLENFRGDLDGAEDAHLTCGEPYADRAVGGMFMVAIPLKFRYKWITSFPSN